MSEYQGEKFLLAATPQQRYHPAYVAWLEQQLEETVVEASRLKKRLASLRKQQAVQDRRAAQQWHAQTDHLDYPDDSYDR